MITVFHHVSLATFNTVLVSYFKGGLLMKIIALNVECNIFFLFFFWWLGYHTVSNPTLETMHMFLICLSRFKPQCVQKALPVMTKKTEYT